MRRFIVLYLVLFAALFASWQAIATRMTLTGAGVTSGGAANVTFDASGVIAFSGAVTSYSYPNLTVGTANGLVAFLWTQNQNNIATAVWDSGGTNQALTFLCRSTTNSGVGQVELWGLIASPVTAGNKLLTATVGASDRIYAGAASFNNVNQTSIAVAFPNCTTKKTAGGGNTDTSISIAQTSASGHIVVAAEMSGISADTITPDNTVLSTNNGSVLTIGNNRGVGAATVNIGATFATAGNLAETSVDISN